MNSLRQSMDISVFGYMSAVWHISTPWDHSFWDISTRWDLSFWHISTRWDLSFYWDKSWTWEISTCWNVLEWEISTGWNIPEWVISRGWDMPNCWHIYKYGNVYWLCSCISVIRFEFKDDVMRVHMSTMRLHFLTGHTHSRDRIMNQNERERK